MRFGKFLSNGEASHATDAQSLTFRWGLNDFTDLTSAGLSLRFCGVGCFAWPCTGAMKNPWSRLWTGFQVQLEVRGPLA